MPDTPALSLTLARTVPGEARGLESGARRGAGQDPHPRSNPNPNPDTDPDPNVNANLNANPNPNPTRTRTRTLPITLTLALTLTPSSHPELCSNQALMPQMDLVMFGDVLSHVRRHPCPYPYP